MNHIKSILFLIFIIPILSFGQKNELLLGLSIGVNYPLGDFASTEYVITEDLEFNNTGQFALLGTAFDFSANYRLGYYLGFAGRIMGGTNKVNNTEYAKALNTILNQDGLETTVTSKGWGNMGVFAGGYFVIPIYDLYIDMRLMGGYINLFSPEIRYYVSDIETKEEELLIKEKYNAAAFAYNVGLGLKYKFSSTKFILFNADYMAADIRKSDINTLNPITREEELIELNVDYRVMTFTIGLGYIF